MKTVTIGFVVAAVAVAAVMCVAVYSHGAKEGADMETMEVYSIDVGGKVEVERLDLSADEWRQKLTPEQFRVAREAGTERPRTGPNWDTKTEGVYRCVACGDDLFLSSAKYESGTGWPSFFQPIDPANIGTKVDRGLWSVRTEVHCARCGAHLGHVFDDGPAPTGLRYCMNGTVMSFTPMDVNGDGRVDAH